jgi:Rrf2 family transcriptional regulator, nitric oxide-sensitive transcriptional repressor
LRKLSCADKHQPQPIGAGHAGLDRQRLGTEDIADMPSPTLPEVLFEYGTDAFLLTIATEIQPPMSQDAHAAHKVSDYALRVLMYVHAADGRLVTIAEMAASYRISRAHLMKVVNALARAGYLTAVRGRTGGLKLAKPAQKIRLGDVVRATEPDFAPVESFSTGAECMIQGCCKLPALWRRALGAFLGELDLHTVASNSLRPKDFRTVFAETAREARRA